MRRSMDLPRRRLPRISGRAVVITLGALVFLVAVFGRAVARFYVDSLWYRALGRGDVFWGQIGAKSLLFLVFLAVFAALAGVNLYVADRTAPTSFPANVHPYVERFHEVFGHRLRLVRYGTAAVLALILALPAVSQWQEWLLFRNSKSFGYSDPQFGVDVGFYVFQLPFLSFTVDWLFAALVIVILLTLAAHLLNGGVLFASATPTVRPATRIHMAVLLAVLAAVKAADYWLTRYDLTNERRGFVQGATYTVVNAQLPALMLLILIALLTAVLFLSTIRTNRWRLPVVASALWLIFSVVGGLIYPAVVESLLVRPNQEEREAPYIARNVDATRVAMGINQVAAQEVSFGRVTADEVEANLDPLRNVRLLNPAMMLSKFSFDVGEVAGLRIVDLDVDRYADADGETRQVLIAARELDLNSIPNKSWQGRHLVSTRGCGLVMAPVGQVGTNDRPVYQELDLERPELYFSDAIGGYAITDTQLSESSCNGNAEYTGEAGVELNGILRRTAFALAFLDYNILGSGAVDSDSQMLWVRSVADRAAKLAPFLSYDTDPYPVAVDGGVQWVIDAYTSTDAFPYAQRIGDVQLSPASTLSGGANYIRNSVKVVVDAYTGEVTFYVMDDDDPILRAWRSAFPDLFTSLDEMPAELREHLRYPEDLFRVQTEMYSKYQLDAENFFRRAGAWSVAQAPEIDRQDNPTPSADATTPPDDSAEAFATESDVDRFVPYYTMFRSGATSTEDFVILRPFVPFSTDDARTELQAIMTASSDPGSYGQLTSYVVDQSPLPAGPARVADRAESDSEIGPLLNRLASNESGQAIRFGDMQLVPVADGLLYVRPVYVTVGDVTEYRYVIVSHDEAAVIDTSLDGALAQLFPGYSGDVGDRVAAGDDDTPVEQPGEPTDPSEPTEPTTPGPPLDGDVAELLLQAEAAFGEAEQHLAEGDLGAYQEAVERAQRLVEQAAEQLATE